MDSLLFSYQGLWLWLSGGISMDATIPVGTDWHEHFQEWLKPFLAVFRRSEQRCWAPLYLQGLLGPGARKSVEPMAERVCPGQRSTAIKN
jgi:hypothetical protein